ncbi:MAG: hypothetical protein K6E10_07835 [Eubacterium sp.]|nr:hypothetical protein [Eubacterium sp.]
MGKGLTTIIILILGISLIVLAYRGYKDQKEREAEYERESKAIEEEIAKDNVYSEEEILEKLENAMIANEDDNVFMRVPTSIDQDTIKEIAQRIDPMLGRVTEYSYATQSQQNIFDDDHVSSEKTDEFAGVSYKYIKYDDYYVYEAIVQGKEIPSDRTKAIKLKEVCQKFIDENITSTMSDYEKELAIHDYIINNCKYTTTFTTEKNEFEAYGVLVDHLAVCEGYAKATSLLLRCCNIESILVSGDADIDDANSIFDTVDGAIMTPDGQIISGHMWNQVKIDGLWYNLDTTWDDPVAEEDVLLHTYFNVDDTILRNNHEWDSKETNQCSSTLANYYEKNGLYFKTDSDFKEYIKNYLSQGSREKIECAVTNADLSEDGMYFLFDYDGINNYMIYHKDIPNYQIIELEFNIN